MHTYAWYRRLVHTYAWYLRYMLVHACVCCAKHASLPLAASTTAIHATFHPPCLPYNPPFLPYKPPFTSNILPSLNRQLRVLTEAGQQQQHHITTLTTQNKDLTAQLAAAQAAASRIPAVHAAPALEV